MVKVCFIEPDGARREADMEAGYSVMEAALSESVSGILAECGGGLVCGTCHVQVADDWLDRVGPPNEVEDMLLDDISSRSVASRLSCQIELTDALDGLVVHIPPSG